MTDIENGKRLASEIIERIRGKYDTHEWHYDEDKWTEAISHELSIESSPSANDNADGVLDISAYFLNYYLNIEKNKLKAATFMKVGIARMLAEEVSDADWLDQHDWLD